MRLALIGLGVTALLAAVDPAAAQRQARPWCLQSSHDGPGGGLPDCTYYTFEQCRAAVGGGTDGCFPNPALGWDRIEGKRAPVPPRGQGR
ncbi:MAG: DUF3551 domain-containing protein [Hyphomicrobiales bacterium]|nr:DUF3551 domain-containing protein [Hyphomicrobiales bacterium]